MNITRTLGTFTLFTFTLTLLEKQSELPFFTHRSLKGALKAMASQHLKPSLGYIRLSTGNNIQKPIMVKTNLGRVKISQKYQLRRGNV